MISCQFTGSLNLAGMHAGSQQNTPVVAADVEYDPDTSGLLATNVQDAIDEIVSSSVTTMTPTVAGTAFGIQDDAKKLNSIGKDVNTTVATNSSIARFLPTIAGNPQLAHYASCTFDDNQCIQDATTSLANSIASINGTNITGFSGFASAIAVNTGSCIGTTIDNSIAVLSTTNASNSPLFKDSVAIANSSSFNGATLDKTIIVASRLNAAAEDLYGTTIIADGTNLVATKARESMVLASNGGVAVNQNGFQSLYVGNQTFGEVVLDRDAYISSYDRFFLRTLRQAAGTNVTMYDPATAELTHVPLTSVFPLKHPTIPGGQFGINNSANVVEINGRNSFNGYSASPPQISGVTAVGNQLYQNNVPGSSSFTDDIFLGHSHQFPNTTSIQNTLIAASVAGNPGISRIRDCNIIVPRNSGLDFDYVGEINGANLISSGSIDCTIDPFYSTVVASGGTVTPGQHNMVLTSTPATSTIVMQGQGNTIIQSSPGVVTYNFPNFSNCTVLIGGTTAIVPTDDSQFCINHDTFRMPNVSAVGTAGATTTPMAFDSATGLISPTLSSLLSRVYRAVGTTAAGGSVVFTPGSGINPQTVGYAMTATVRTAAGSVACVAQIQGVSSTSVTIQVFTSINAVNGTPTMAPAGAGIIVHFIMAY